MLRRQRVLLDLIRLAGGSATVRELTALCFLFREEGDESVRHAFYEFVRRQEGPLSFCIRQEIPALAAGGFLEPGNGETWRLTRTGAGAAAATPDALKRQARMIHARYGSSSPKELSGAIASRHPGFAPPGKAAALAIYTAGYEGLTVDGFLDLLVRSGVGSLIDVRNNPSARRYGFHRSTLQRLCTQVEIEYRPFPCLGIRSELRQDLSDQAARDRLFDLYARTTLVEETEAVNEVAGLMRQRPGVLVCMETLPQECHRSRLAAAVRDRTGLDIRHLVA